ncbi:hypothetical protein D9756_010383 [Leucocoprinus leucothites]|uniref:Major facilitator superfamily (MFS) profile domain-containing protein n=1 Tax=Leucocoprinus leucothites TaxID=201217 RepID=A0A8H5FRA7_9AGAR|nr:hypothetical protein D9756_010383 [Leucoagaricus leucothites]
MEKPGKSSAESDKPRTPQHVYSDSSTDGAVESLTKANEARLEKVIWWKVDMYILPASILIYLLSWIDRTNIGNARVAGLQDDLQLTPTEYSIALTITFIPYILIELPSNLILKIVGPNILLPTLLVCWGIVSTLQGVVENYSGFIACRFFLGFFEGGLFPGLVLYLSCFYPRDLLQLRISALFSSVALSGAFSGLLATAISKMDGVGNRPAWAWIFILEGLFTIVFGILSFWIPPQSPDTAWFLSSEEKAYVTQRLKEANSAGRDDLGQFSWREVGEAFKSPHIWFLAVNTFFGSAIVYALAYFAPSIVFTLGFSPIRTQLMSVPPFAAAFIGT